jgi:hypothetical protein
LQEMHAHIATLASWCATQLEGSYIPQEALRTYDPVRVLHLHIDRGENERLQRMQIDDPDLSRAWWSGWVFLRAVLWEHGITLAGPDPRSLVEPVRPGELRQAAMATLEGWLAPLLEQPAQIENRGFQSYIVLTVCRLLYTFELDAIASKQVAARWAQQRLGENWGALIDQAWMGRHHPGEKASPEAIRETQDFIRFMQERSRDALPKTTGKEQER